MNRLLQGFVFLTASMFASVAVAQSGAIHRIDIVEVGSTTGTMTLSPPITKNGEFSFDLYQSYTYPGNPGGITSLEVRIHYDNTVLEPVELSYVNEGSSGSFRTFPATGRKSDASGSLDIESDALQSNGKGNYDGDDTTNQYYMLGWSGPGGLFTELPSRLVTAKFKWIGTRTGTTRIALSREMDTGPQDRTGRALFASNSPVNIEPNFDSPTVPGDQPIASQILALGETRTIQLTAGTTTGNFNFVDADTAELGYEVDSSAVDKVRATITANNEVLLEARGTGTAVITVFARQGSNPEATQSFAVTVNVPDTTPPEPPAITTLGTLTNTVLFTLAGSAEPGSTVELLRGMDSLGTATATNGSWAIVVMLTDGANAITATATDDAGNKSSLSASVTITLDRVSISTQAQSVKTASFTLAGSAEPGSTVKLFRGEDSFGTATATNKGSWTITVMLGQGANTFTATAPNVAGNPSRSDEVTITLDMTPPEPPTITTPDTLTNKVLFTLAGSAETGSTVELFRGEDFLSAAIATNGSWTIFVTLTDGANTITATATDAAGNKSSLSASVTITLDRVSISTQARSVNTASFTLAGSAETGSAVELFRGEDSLGVAIATNGFWTITVTLTDGANAITATATDAAGSTSTSDAVTITLDMTPPVITLVGSARLAIRKSPAIGTDSVYVDAGAFAKDNIDGNIRALPIRTITFNGGSVDAVDTKKVGVYIITYNISDAAGNPATPVTRMVEVTGGINIGNNGPTAIAGNKIIIFFYEELTITGTVTSDFMVSGAPPDTLVTGLDLEDFGYTLALTLSNNIAKNAAVKLAYMKTTGSISGAFSGVVLKNFSDERVITDNIPAIAPEVETAQVNEDRTAIILTFDKDIILNNVSNSRFTVVTNRGTEDRTSVPVAGLSVTGKVLTVSLDTADTATATAIERSTVTLSYNLPTAGQTGITGTGVDGGVVTAFQRIMTTGPAVDTPTITPPAVTLVNTESLTLSGMGRAGSNVQLCRDVVFSVGSTTVSANGDWTIEVMLVGDENSITVQPEGECLPAVQGRSEVLVIVQDTFPPSGPVIQTLAQTFNVAPNSTNIEGTADAGSTVELFRGAESIGTATVTGGTTTVTGGTTTTGGSWTISVMSLNEGANVFKATATDAAGNVSIDYQNPPEVTITLDTIAPTVSITSASGVSGSIVSTNTLRYTATFSEAVTGFELSDITLTGTANGGDPVASNLQGAGAVYTFDVVRGSTDGTVTVSIAANVAKDDADNDNTVSNDHTLIIDTTSPAVIITSGSGATNSTVNANTLSYTATFSMIVGDFGVGNITVAGTAGVTSASNFVANSGNKTFTFDVVRGNIDGTVIVSIAADVAHRQDGLATSPPTCIC